MSRLHVRKKRAEPENRFGEAYFGRIGLTNRANRGRLGSFPGHSPLENQRGCLGPGPVLLGGFLSDGRRGRRSRRSRSLRRRGRRGRGRSHRAGRPEPDPQRPQAAGAQALQAVSAAQQRRCKEAMTRTAAHRSCTDCASTPERHKRPEPHRGPGPGPHRGPEPHRSAGGRSARSRAAALAGLAATLTQTLQEPRMAALRSCTTRKQPEAQAAGAQGAGAGAAEPHRVPEPEPPEHRQPERRTAPGSSSCGSDAHADAPRAADGSSPEQIHNRRPEPHKQPEAQAIARHRQVGAAHQDDAEHRNKQGGTKNTGAIHSRNPPT